MNTVYTGAQCEYSLVRAREHTHCPLYLSIVGKVTALLKARIGALSQLSPGCRMR